ncbi:MAG TPA: hypothetical protein DIT75_03645 [Rikenellaceae bacterium]|nr:hypothetical protein [Rikenellaceae bacterium]
MKKSILLTALAFVALGCSKTEVKPVEDAPAQISWNAVVGKASTKAMIDGTKYETSAPSFGTFAYFLQEGSWADNKTDGQLYIPISEVKASGTGKLVWTTETPYYWPKAGKLTFFTYSPYNYQETAGGQIPVSIVANSGLTVANYNVDAHQDTDFMVADAAVDKNNNESITDYDGVPVAFKHKLSQIVGINIQTVKGTALHDYANEHDGSTGKEYVSGDVVFKLKKVQLTDILTQGKYSYETAEPTSDGWTNQSTTKTYVWYDDAAGVNFTDNNKFELKYNTKDAARNAYLLVLPQTFGDPDEQATTVKTSLDIVFQILTCNGVDTAGNATFSTQNVSKSIYLYKMHCDTHNSDAEHAIAMNKKITYTIKIDLDNNGQTRIYWAPSVENWQEEAYSTTI